MCLLLISPSQHYQKHAPSTSKCYMASVSFTHVHFDYGHASPSQLIWQRDYHDNGFSTWLFYILVCLFCLYSLPVIVVLVMKVLWKNGSDVKWLPFFNILRILVHWINAKEYSENSWEMTLGFSRTIMHGNLARSRKYEQYRNQKQRQQKGDETKFIMRWQKNKSNRIFFPQERYRFWHGRRGVELQKSGPGRVKT